MDTSLPSLNGMANVPGANNNMMMGSQSNALPTTTPNSMSMPSDQRGNEHFFFNRMTFKFFFFELNPI